MIVGKRNLFFFLGGGVENGQWKKTVSYFGGKLVNNTRKHTYVIVRTEMIYLVFCTLFFRRDRFLLISYRAGRHTRIVNGKPAAA